MEQLFVYGTLRDPHIQQRVFGRLIASVPDALDGYQMQRIVLAEGEYPIIAPHPSSSVEGHILQVTEEELARADRYETDAYRRVSVTLRSGRRAWVYCA